MIGGIGAGLGSAASAVGGMAGYGKDNRGPMGPSYMGGMGPNNYAPPMSMQSMSSEQSAQYS